jgi:hypothetical protein
MPEYKVQHSYASNQNGRRFGPWAEGDVIDLDTPDAEWVNRDSPDTLAGDAAEPEPVDPDVNPVVDVDAAVEIEPEPVEAKPPVKRARWRS